MMLKYCHRTTAVLLEMNVNLLCEWFECCFSRFTCFLRLFPEARFSVHAWTNVMIGRRKGKCGGKSHYMLKVQNRNKGCVILCTCDVEFQQMSIQYESFVTAREI